MQRSMPPVSKELLQPEFEMTDVKLEDESKMSVAKRRVPVPRGGS